MGIIQKILSPLVDKKPIVDPFNNPYIKIIKQSGFVGTFECMIGDNYVKKLILGLDYEKFLSKDIFNLNLQFLVEANYKADVIEIGPVESNSDIFKINFFRGTLKGGNIVCDEFMGSVKGGSVDGLYLQSDESDKYKISHPGVFIKGLYGLPFGGKAGKVDCNESIFGLKPYNEMRLNQNTADKSISIIALNTNQSVSIVDDKGDEFSFHVQVSYKQDGTCMKIVEDSIEKEITWQNIRRSNTPNYNLTGFEQRSRLTVGKKCYIPTLFEGKDVGVIKEIRIFNNQKAAQVNTSAQVKNNVFVPKKFKI